MGKRMVKEQKLSLMETSLWESSRMGKNMVKELSLGQMVKSMKGNGKMGDLMVEEPTYFLMEVKGLESSEMVDLGTLLTGIKTETS